MIAEIHILSSRLEPLVKKTYRDEFKSKMTVDIFSKKIQDILPGHLPPHFKEENVFFFFIKRNTLYFIATSAHEMSPVIVIELLSRLYHICKDFCGVVNEDAVRSNVLLLYELLDEVLDCGYVQLANTEKLKPYVSSEPVVIDSGRSMQEDVAARLFGIDNRVVPFTAANKPVIRSNADLETRRNEIFVDVIERLTTVIDSNGTISHVEINGSVNMKNFLIGSPQIRIALNDDLIINKEGELKGFGHNVQLDRCNFHQCVNLDDFEKERILKIYPPTGEFSIVTYAASGEIPVNLPLRVMSFVSDIQESRDLDVTLRVRCEIPMSCQAVYVAVKLKIPKIVASISQHLSGQNQTAEFRKAEKMIVWKIKKFPGSSEVMANFRLIPQSGEKINRKEVGPVLVDFEISGYTCTGFQIRFMRVYDTEHSYVPFRWVRYITVSDSFTVKV